MATFDTNSFVHAVLTNASDLAAKLFEGYVGQAEADTRAFLQATRDDIARDALLYKQGQIDKDDFEDLIKGKKDLAEMHALKNTGLASAAIDTFINGVITIMINAAFAALKI